jgi:hypothetical protein
VGKHEGLSDNGKKRLSEIDVIFIVQMWVNEVGEEIDRTSANWGSKWPKHRALDLSSPRRNTCSYIGYFVPLGIIEDRNEAVEWHGTREMDRSPTPQLYLFLRRKTYCLLPRTARTKQRDFHIAVVTIFPEAVHLV